MVKNEADIIEAFVRHNLYFIDELWLIENGSSDGTKETLHLLLEHGYRVVLIEDHSFGYNQSEKMTALYRRVVRERKPDYVIPLDADEFIQAPNQNSLRASLGAISPSGVGRWLWRTCVPTDTSTSTISRRFGQARRHEAVRHGKIVIRCPKHDDPTAVIAQGYHSMTRNEKLVSPLNINGPYLAHIPIRSANQLAQKAILGWMANVAHFKTLDPACGFHWGDLYRRVFDMTDRDLLHEAYNYSERTPTNDYALLPSKLTIHGYGELKLPDRANINYRALLELVCRSWEASLLQT